MLTETKVDNLQKPYSRKKNSKKLLHCYTITLNKLSYFLLKGVAAHFCYTLLHLATPFWPKFGLI